jgi:hypothetical protein
MLAMILVTVLALRGAGDSFAVYTIGTIGLLEIVTEIAVASAYLGAS